MMQIENTWNSQNESIDDDLSSLLQHAKLRALSSHSPLKKIKLNLVMNMIMGGMVSMVYVFIILYYHIWQVQVAMTVVLIFSLWAIQTALSEYKKMDADISPVSSVLAELKRHEKSISNWMKIQQKVALFVYPVSAAGGFMLGGVVGSGKPVAVFMSKPIIWVALFIAIAVLVPACYYLAKWMFNISFGKHLKALQENIRALETEK